MTPDLITSEMVEKAARAAYSIVREESNCDVDPGKDCRECGAIAMKVARAALEAVLPDLLKAIQEQTEK